MTSERKNSLDATTVLNDDNVVGCAAAAAAGAIAALNIPSVCEESIQAAVLAATTAAATSDPVPSNKVVTASISSSDISEGDGGFFMSKDSDGTSVKVNIMHANHEQPPELNPPHLDDRDFHGILKEEDEDSHGMNNLEVESLCHGGLTSNSHRERFESWGGLSDLSLTGMGSFLDDDVNAAAALAASALQQTGIIDDITAAAASIDVPSPLAGPNLSVPSPMVSVASETTDFDSHSLSHLMLPPAKLDPNNLAHSTKTSPLNMSLNDTNSSNSKIFPRPRSLSSQFPYIVTSHQHSYDSHQNSHNVNSRKNSFSSPQKSSSNVFQSISFTYDLESLVAAAVSAASIPFHDTNKSIPHSTTTGHHTTSTHSSKHKPPVPDFISSTKADTVCEVATLAALKVQEAMHGTKSNPKHTTSTTSVVTPNILSTKSHPSQFTMPLKSKPNNSYPSSSTTLTTPLKTYPQAFNNGSTGSSSLPYLNTNDQTPIHSNKKRKTAHTNATYPSSLHPTISHHPPGPLYTTTGTTSTPTTHNPQFRGVKSTIPMKPTPTTKKKGNINPAAVFTTPIKGKGSMTKIKKDVTSPSLTSPSGSTGQSNQKWEDMFNCLVKYVETVREDETKGASPEAKKAWEWCGNVPTTYKTPDGKALGRWINNQRSAKNKGSLKADRESRLVSTGLKWSVLSTNAWPDMMNELRIYVRDKTKDGQKWDGNVPTNYRIKSNIAADGTEIDEEKNLGRWINRQRSLFQGGRLKKERQRELENIGLKWSVLSTTSWETMYDALCKYAMEKRNVDPEHKWDGNVPANYKTEEQKSLGRWVNRQRSAFAKRKLKAEWVKKLNAIGLKWSVHERKNGIKNSSDSPPMGGGCPPNPTNPVETKKDGSVMGIQPQPAPVGNNAAPVSKNVNGLETSISTDEISPAKASTISYTGTTLIT